MATLLMPTEQPGMLMHVFGLMAVFLGVMLILCSRNLAHRATLVMWEGVLRLGGFIVMTGYGLRGGGALMIGSGVFDLLVGIFYILLLPRYLHTGALDLVLDRPHAARP